MAQAIRSQKLVHRTHATAFPCSDRLRLSGNVSFNMHSKTMPLNPKRLPIQILLMAESDENRRNLIPANVLISIKRSPVRSTPKNPCKKVSRNRMKSRVLMHAMQ
jgi:hypothetical protein